MKFSNVKFDERDPNDVIELFEVIGRGAYADVYRGKMKGFDDDIAVKTINYANETTTEEEEQDIEREVSILTKLTNSNVVKCFGVFKDEENIYICMELLFQAADEIYLDTNEALPENYIRIIVKGTLLGLDYIHQKKITHRDIKGANIMLSSNGDVKIVDFGTATTRERSTSLIGTPYWMAPEVVENRDAEVPYGVNADIWSLGITAVELAERGPPLQDMHPMRALLKLGGDYQPELKEPELYSKDFVDFVNLALRKDPSKRPTAAELLKHPFIVNGKYDMEGFKKLQLRANKMKEEDLAQEGEDEEYDSTDDEEEKKPESSSSNKKLQNSTGSVDSPKVENKRESKNEKNKRKTITKQR